MLVIISIVILVFGLIAFIFMKNNKETFGGGYSQINVYNADSCRCGKENNDKLKITPNNYVRSYYYTFPYFYNTPYVL